MTSIVTASTVRNYFRADEARMARLSPEAQATVKEGARGLLHPQAVKAFNGKRKPERRYVAGANAKAKAQAVAARESLRAQGVKVGTRGPLPKVSNAQPKA